MKRITIVCFFFALVTIINAQWKVNSFDNLAATNFFKYPVPGNTNNLGTGTGFVTLTDDVTNKREGAAGLKVEWTVNTTESWGGFLQMMYRKPSEDKTYLDFSMAQSISIWYNNLVPSTRKGSVHMRFKIHEGGGESKYWDNQADAEDWYFESAIPYDDTPGWKQLIIPLKDLGPVPPVLEQGFSLPGWSGVANNGTLDLDKIVGFSIEVTAPVVDGNIATGTIVWDDLTLLGSKYTPLTNFDNTATGYFTLDTMGWDAGNKGKITLTDVKNNPFEGESSLKIDYTVNATQSWGGYANMEHIFTTPLNLAANTDLYCAITNLTANSLPGRLQFRLVLYDDTGSKRENWFTLFDIDIDKTSDWTTVRIPLTKTAASSWDLQKGIFINPPDQGNDDGIFSLGKIAGFKIEFSVTGSDKGPVGPAVLSEGSVMIDFLVPAGFQETDKTPPNPPSKISAVPGIYTNLITWEDTPGETGEKYNVYYSVNPISDVNAAGVEVVKSNIPEGVQVVDHVLRAPATDQNVTYFYAVTTKDKAGNIGQPNSTGSSIKNRALGVPVISLAVPTNFKADGNLAEWANITPIEMKPSKGAPIAPNTKIDNDADLSVLAYLAIDGTYLYVAIDVTDDIVNPSVKAESYLNDAPDLFIGLYDWRGAKHTVYQRGNQPDYHLRFNKKAVRNEGGGGDIDSLLTPGVNYYWQEQSFPKQGYVIEARIPLNDLATKRNNPDLKTDVINVKEGFRIPIDFSINDNDTGERDGIMTYSPENQDQSWADVSRWTYTWIGDKWDPVTAVEEEENIPTQFTLSQNYPNPFNPSTVISYKLPVSSLVTLKVYDILGRLVAELVNKYQEAGSYHVNFNASQLSAGVYFYRMESGSFVNVKKMLLIK